MPTTTTPDPLGGGASPTTTTTAGPESCCLAWPTVTTGFLWTHGYMDPNWYGNSNDTYSGHGGIDINFHGSMPGPPDQATWDDMNNNPVSVYAACDGVVVAMVDSYEDECDNNPQSPWNSDPNDPVHGNGGTNCTGSYYPNYVKIDHGAVTFATYGYRYTLYLHLQKGSIPSGITVGSAVTKGQEIGKIGSSGYSSWPHLHFAALDSSSSPVDPFLGISPHGSNTTASMWCDQCNLPLHGLPGASVPLPPTPGECDTCCSYESEIALWEPGGVYIEPQFVCYEDKVFWCDRWGEFVHPDGTIDGYECLGSCGPPFFSHPDGPNATGDRDACGWTLMPGPCDVGGVDFDWGSSLESYGYECCPGTTTTTPDPLGDEEGEEEGAEGEGEFTPPCCPCECSPPTETTFVVEVCGRGEGPVFFSGDPDWGLASDFGSGWGCACECTAADCGSTTNCQHVCVEFVDWTSPVYTDSLGIQRGGVFFPAGDDVTSDDCFSGDHDCGLEGQNGAVITHHQGGCGGCTDGGADDCELADWVNSNGQCGWMWDDADADWSQYGGTGEGESAGNIPCEWDWCTPEAIAACTTTTAEPGGQTTTTTACGCPQPGCWMNRSGPPGDQTFAYWHPWVNGQAVSCCYYTNGCYNDRLVTNGVEYGMDEWSGDFIDGSLCSPGMSDAELAAGVCPDNSGACDGVSIGQCNPGCLPQSFEDTNCQASWGGACNLPPCNGCWRVHNATLANQYGHNCDLACGGQVCDYWGCLINHDDAKWGSPTDYWWVSPNLCPSNLTGHPEAEWVWKWWDVCEDGCTNPCPTTTTAAGTTTTAPPTTTTTATPSGSPPLGTTTTPEASCSYSVDFSLSWTCGAVIQPPPPPPVENNCSYTVEFQLIWPCAGTTTTSPPTTTTCPPRFPGSVINPCQDPPCDCKDIRAVEPGACPECVPCEEEGGVGDCCIECKEITDVGEGQVWFIAVPGDNAAVDNGGQPCLMIDEPAIIALCNADAGAPAGDLAGQATPVDINNCGWPAGIDVLAEDTCCSLWQVDGLDAWEPGGVYIEPQFVCYEDKVFWCDRWGEFVHPNGTIDGYECLGSCGPPVFSHPDGPNATGDRDACGWTLMPGPCDEGGVDFDWGSSLESYGYECCPATTTTTGAPKFSWRLI